MRKSLIFIFIVLISINACQKNYKAETKATAILSDFQITACNTAHVAKTCDTRLPELGIVLKEDCCKGLGKCC